jgi:hypothetical protein
LSKSNQNLPGSCVLLLSVWLFSACDYISFSKVNAGEGTEESVPLASVGDIFLYKKDLEGIVPQGIAIDDSIGLVERHVKDWVKKQLVISEAQKQLTFDEVELERRVLDYRYALMMHEFEKNMIQKRLDTNISEEEIVAYYNENLQNFELKQNILRGYFIQLSNDAPKLNRFRYLIRSSRKDLMEELKSYAYSYGTKVHLNDSVWVNFEDLINNTPLMKIPNKTDFLQRNRYFEIPGEDYIYFLKITQYKIQNDTSPLEFVRDDIQKIILNKRKVRLAKELEESIYENAVQNDGFKIY